MEEKLNVNGSGISLGHPIACTGTRVLVSLLYEMRRRGARYALECICGGGGLGIAAVFERVEGKLDIIADGDPAAIEMTDEAY